ncbi:hypothetical protein A2442_03125 [Candidatus Campbellbacteria bacterium RIFOXYC2_FULL_35_25]|uniref:Uncharacterized protein n=1 Tax=Candidatus Campbellbacteria bacterium RIFOXYC2_FULL_35_25 TaxID=1797582 RepID=A0A1F5EJ61_9BACT|nr:MAG: hypothetical protein A2442_03125 [Candidatus Campbellbacteria bacterium RIFOXYC2_FULL_35_25]
MKKIDREAIIIIFVVLLVCSLFRSTRTIHSLEENLSSIETAVMRECDFSNEECITCKPKGIVAVKHHLDGSNEFIWGKDKVSRI